MANAIDLSTKDGLSVIDPLHTDPAKQKALLVLWALVLTNSDFLSTQTRIANSASEVATIQADAAGAAKDIQYIYMPNITAKLPQLDPTYISTVLAMARGDQTYSDKAAQFYTQGEATLGYSVPRYCLGVPTVLALNS